MICKICVPIIIAISYLPILAAKNSSVLDINNYTIYQNPGEPPPKKYSVIKFVSSTSSKASSVAYGPIQIWEGISSGKRVESVDLELLAGLPQLVKIQVSKGSESEDKYFKWEKGRFVPETHENYLSYQTIIKEEDGLLDYTVLLDLKKGPNLVAFEKSTSEISGSSFDTYTPKSYFNLVGIIYEANFVCQHDGIESVDYLKVSSGPRFLIVKIKGAQHHRFFIFDNGWKECNEAEAQQFLTQLSTGAYTPTTPRESQTSPAKPEGPFYATLEPILAIPEVFSDEQLKAMNLVKQPPVMPSEFIPATSPNPQMVVFDINAKNPNFVINSEPYAYLDTITIVPKDGLNISQLVDSGIPIWTNTRYSKVSEIILYERRNLVTLVILKANRYGEKIQYYHRFKGKFSPCNEYEFKQLFIQSKHTENYNKSISYTLYGPNNLHVFKEVNKLVDGVHFLTVHPKDGYEFMRIVNGSDHLTKPSDEQWSTFTIIYFDSTHKLISLNVVKNKQNHVKYFKCVGSLQEIDYKTHLNLFQQYKAHIHVQSNIVFDLTKKENAGYTTRIGHSTELSPISGYHVKMVTLGDFVLWKSQEARCTSVLLTTPDALSLVCLNITTGDTLSQEYFRIFSNKVFRIQTLEEYEFMKKLIVENLKNPNAEVEMASLTYDVTFQYNLMVFDASVPNKSVVSHTSMTNIVMTTSYAPKDGYVFGEVRFGTKTLWKTTDIRYYCTKLVLYFFKNEPRLGIMFMVNNQHPATEYFYYGGLNPMSLDKSTFDNKLNELVNAHNMAQVQPVGYETSLDLLKFDNYTANGSRKSGLFSVEYVHKQNKAIQIVLFGYEILWATKGSEAASKVRVVYYDMQPMLLELTMNDQEKTVKYYSHYNRIWHKIDPALVDNQLNGFVSLEIHRKGFTLPGINEKTDFEEKSTQDEFFTTKKFLSGNGLIATVLDGRNRLHKPDSLSFVESLVLHYHGETPKLLSFREKNAFGYYFDFYLVYSSGWRFVSFAKFEQLFNYHRKRPPKAVCAMNQFVFDIFQPDPRVKATRLTTQQFAFEFTITDDNYTFCSVNAGDAPIWTPPPNRYVKTFFVYYDGNNAKLARFEEEDANKDKEEIYIQLEGHEWTEIDEFVYINALSNLAQKYNDTRARPQSPPEYVPGEQPESPQSVPSEPTQPTVPQDVEMLTSLDSTAFVLPPGIYQSPSLPPTTLKDVVMTPIPVDETFIPPAKKEKPTPPGSITASTLSSQTSQKIPKPIPQLRVIPTPVRPSPPSPTRASPIIPGLTPVLPSGSVSLDVLGQENREYFRYGSGNCDKVVPFKEIKAKTGIFIRMVTAGDKVAWYTESPSYLCTSVKIFFRDNTPVLMEFLIKDKHKNTSKYVFSLFDDNNWLNCDQDMFDGILDSMVAYYQGKQSTQS